MEADDSFYLTGGTTPGRHYVNQVLTQPDFRAGYGCKCRITEIKIYR